MKAVITQDQFDRLIKPSEKMKERLKSMGYEQGSKFVGSGKNYVDIMFDGDVKKYFKENNLNSYYITRTGMDMYLSDALVSVLDLPNDGKDKFLGNFVWVSGGFRYRISVYLTQVSKGYIEPEGFKKQKMWRVKGRSGDSGWGFPFLTKRETIGVRGRQQVFKQIIEKLGL